MLVKKLSFLCLMVIVVLTTALLARNFKEENKAQGALFAKSGSIVSCGISGEKSLEDTFGGNACSRHWLLLDALAGIDDPARYSTCLIFVINELSKDNPDQLQECSKNAYLRTASALVDQVNKQ